MILVPKSFLSINFGSLSGAYPESMDISSGTAQLLIEQVAGGRLFDFNYGQRATITPNPFEVVLILDAATVTALSNLYESLASPHSLSGIVGRAGTFTATAEGANNWQCSAACEQVTKVLRSDDSIDKNTLLAGVSCHFVAITNWIEV